MTDLLQLADRVERDEIKALSIKQPYRKQPRCKTLLCRSRAKTRFSAAERPLIDVGVKSGIDQSRVEERLISTFRCYAVALPTSGPRPRQPCPSTAKLAIISARGSTLSMLPRSASLSASSTLLAMNREGPA